MTETTTSSCCSSCNCASEPTTKRYRMAFFGLGAMGFPMAGYLQKAGHDVCVYNRTTAKSEKWVEIYGGRMALSPKEAAEGCDFVFSCVGDDNDLREVTIGENGCFQVMAPGSCFVDHTTASPSVERELAAKAKELGIDFADVPISGGQAGAENGVLTAICGCEEDVFERLKPILALHSKKINRFGPVGAGQTAKMVNQICMAGIIESLAEGIAFGVNSGILDMHKVMDALTIGAAGSWQMSNRSHTMVDAQFDGFGFRLDWMRKDFSIAMEEAKKSGTELPVLKLVDSLFEDCQKQGWHDQDTSILVLRLSEKLRQKYEQGA